MNSIHTLSILLVFIGALFMAASIKLSLKTGKSVPSSLQNRWKILTCLMFFFLGGYLTFLVGQIRQINIPIELISGIVFFGGALFVFLIINLTKTTVSKIRAGEKLLQNANDQLEIRVEQRTDDLKKALGDLGKEVIEREKTALSLEEVNTELVQILNSTADGIRVIDTNFIMQRVNRPFAEMAGLPKEKLVGTLCHESFKGHACHTPDCPVQRILHGEKRVDCEVEVQTPDNQSVPCIVTAIPYYNPEGELIGVVEGFRDISDRKRMENKLKEISVTDELTGILNRRGFLSMAEKQLILSERLNKTMYLLYADIDNMKWINDTLGHAIGDQALVEAAGLLRDTCRKADLIGIGRLGGDEFAILMFSDDITPCCDHPVVKRIDINIEERNKKADSRYNLSISTGIVRYDSETHSTVEEFLSCGDEAMYLCKKERKNSAANAPNCQPNTTSS
jgi:diguanylate cyclase (GGDEF)-like protein/PAS domain S-box-containing protein